MLYCIFVQTTTQWFHIFSNHIHVLLLSTYMYMHIQIARLLSNHSAHIIVTFDQASIAMPLTAVSGCYIGSQKRTYMYMWETRTCHAPEFHSLLPAPIEMCAFTYVQFTYQQSVWALFVLINQVRACNSTGTWTLHLRTLYSSFFACSPLHHRNSNSSWCPLCFSAVWAFVLGWHSLCCQSTHASYT